MWEDGKGASMTTSQPSNIPARSEGAAARQGHDRDDRRRHEEVIIQAEVRRLARALAPYGVLHRDALERLVGAQRWHAGGFDDALAAAVRAGEIRRLSFGYYRDASHIEDPSPPPAA
jgi:hypothetical protein